MARMNLYNKFLSVFRVAPDIQCVWVKCHEIFGLDSLFPEGSPAWCRLQGLQGLQGKKGLSQDV
eukprot:1139288-Pelagomonas_calceolata.AAC.4